MFARLFETTSTLVCWAFMPVAAMERARMSVSLAAGQGADGRADALVFLVEEALAEFVGPLDLDHPRDLRHRVDVRFLDEALEHPALDGLGAGRCREGHPFDTGEVEGVCGHEKPDPPEWLTVGAERAVRGDGNGRGVRRNEDGCPALVEQPVAVRRDDVSHLVRGEGTGTGEALAPGGLDEKEARALDGEIEGAVRAGQRALGEVARPRIGKAHRQR